MHSISIRLLMCCALVGGLAACDIEEGDTDAGPPDPRPDASIGAGGEGGEGGEGGVGGEGGEGGGSMDGPCAELGEQACVARADCAPRRDVVGAFVDCRPLGDVSCGMLDADDCDAREDCDWADDICSPVEVACADYADAGSCGGNGCHWYDDTCHDDPQPARCDQPDPGSCENAGCMWTDVGCMPIPPACADLPNQGPCNARPDCRWHNNRCEVDPGEMACGELALADCAERADCLWTDDACVDRPMGACGELNPEQCEMRPDCEGEWVDCECAPGEECDACDEAFICAPRAIECGDVPLDACERTPGCTVEEPEFCDENCNCPPDAECDCIECEGVCVPDDAFRCEQLGIAACERDPECHVEWMDDCGGNGARPGGDGDADFIGEPCGQVPVCVEGPGEGGLACFDIVDPARCEATDGCGLEEVCDCGDPPPPDACGCEPGQPCPCLIAVPCECEVQCVPMGGPVCEAIGDPRQCDATPGCHAEEMCACEGDDGRAAAPPAPCDCPEGEACDCGDALIAPPCECQFACVSDDQPWGCEGLDQRACFNDPSCEWIEGDIGGGECGCFIDEAGQEICFCEGGDPVEGGGFCVDAEQPDLCGDVWEQDRCDATFGCEWLPAPGGMCPPCFFDDAGNEICPDCPPDGGGICVQAGDPCGGFDEFMCAEQRECRWEFDGGADPAVPCACEPGPDGEVICDCGEPLPRPAPGGGRCVWNGPVGPEQCFDLGPDGCDADANCRWFEQDGGIMCPPCPPGEDCPPCAAPAGICLPLEVWCGQLDIDACGAEPACMVEEVEVCAGGGAEPICPPDEACEPFPVPPPPDGECWVEQYCTFGGWDDGDPADGGGAMDPRPEPAPQPAPR